MNYNIISTGSHGNAVVLNDNILVDCGVSFKALNEVYKNLQLVLLTHEHSDHINKKTLIRLAKERPALRFGCCQWLVKLLVKIGIPKTNIDVYEICKVYDYKAFKISPIRLYHGNCPQCGYRVFVGEEKAFYATDTAHLKGISAKHYDLYLIEANYEDKELQDRINAKIETGQYCYELNVANRHLSKEQADEFLIDNMAAHSRYEYLHGHISREVVEDWTYE